MEAIQLRFPRLSKIYHNGPIIQYNLIRNSSTSLFNDTLPCLFVSDDDNHFGTIIKMMNSEWKYYNAEYMFIGLFVMKHKCVLLRKISFGVCGFVGNTLSKEFDLNVKEEVNDLFSELVCSCRKSDEALVKGSSLGRFEYYSREFTCLFRESCKDDYVAFDCLEDGLSQLEELKEIFEIDESKSQLNCINLILGKGTPTFVLPHQRQNEWNVKIQFQYWKQNEIYFHSTIAKPKDSYKNSWENFFDIKSLQNGISDFPTDYIEICKNEITDLIQKFKIPTRHKPIPDLNSFTKFDTDKQAEEFVKKLFSKTLAEFIPDPPLGQQGFVISVKCDGQLEIVSRSPAIQKHGNVVVNVNGNLRIFGITLKSVIEENWANFLNEIYNKTNSREKRVKEMIHKFHSKRRDVSLEQCLENIFETKVTFTKESISCFGTKRLTITFIGEWNGKKAFFKLSMQDSVNKEILTYISLNNCKLRETHSNISQIYHYQSITDNEKMEYFLDAVAKLRDDIGEEQVRVLLNVKSLDISVQEYLFPITEILRFTKTNSQLRLCKHIISQCISILKQLDSLDILHQDISLDNLMIRKRDKLFELVLIDFDFSETYTKGTTEYSVRMSINVDECYVTKHPYWCENKKSSVGDIYSMSIVIFEIIYYICFRIDYVGEYFSGLQNSGVFRVELVKYLRNKSSLKVLLGNEFKSIKNLLEYMLYYEQNPTLASIIDMMSHLENDIVFV